MAKALSTGSWLDRAAEKRGWSNKQLGEYFGRSASTMRDIRSGRRPGENLREAARDLAKGKRQPTPPPPARRPPKLSKHPNAKKIAKALKSLLKKDKKGVDKVVIYINMPGAGKSLTLGAHGGIPINEILKAGSLKDFLEEQADRQKYKLKLLPDDEESEPGSEDWDDTDLIDSIEFEEYS